MLGSSINHELGGQPKDRCAYCAKHNIKPTSALQPAMWHFVGSGIEAKERGLDAVVSVALRPVESEELYCYNPKVDAAFVWARQLSVKDDACGPPIGVTAVVLMSMASIHATPGEDLAAEHIVYILRRIQADTPSAGVMTAREVAHHRQRDSAIARLLQQLQDSKGPDTAIDSWAEHEHKCWARARKKRERRGRVRQVRALSDWFRNRAIMIPPPSCLVP